MIYNVTNHPALSGKSRAQAQDAPDLFAQSVLTAESLLRVPLEPYLNHSATVVALAVVLQVNYQLEWGIDPILLRMDKSEVQQATRIYHTGASVLNPVAVALLAGIIDLEGDLAGVWGPPVQTLRGPSA